MNCPQARQDCAQKVVQHGPRMGSLLLSVWAFFFAATNHAVAVVKPDRPEIPFQFGISAMRASLNLPLSVRVENVAMSDRVMRERVRRSPSDPTVEPLQLVMQPDEIDINEMAAKLARPGRYPDLAAWFKHAVRSAPRLREGSAARLVDVDAKAWPMMEPSKFSGLFSRSHHNLTVDVPSLSPDTADKMLQQIALFIPEADRKKVAARIRGSLPLTVDKDILPPFARKVVKRYVAWKGPNCFHAALAFQSPLYTSSSLINVKAEEGYHRAMINYDELWRVIRQAFYEVDPRQSELKYGDMLVFFDVESNDPKNIDFKWIRHTATYLFNGYTFSKGSKSSNTPYTVRTLQDEWDTWQKYTKRLGVKVFRRSQNHATSNPPKDLADWLY